jgi:hypothetical protein
MTDTRVVLTSSGEVDKIAVARVAIAKWRQEMLGYADAGVKINPQDAYNRAHAETLALAERLAKQSKEDDHG